MMLMVFETKMDAKIVAWVDQPSFNKAVSYARDTKKKIDKELQGTMEINIAKAELNLKRLRKELRETKSEQRKIEIQVDIRRASNNLTEMKRQLRNLENQWDKSMSRLQTKFNWIGKSIIGSFVNPITLGIGAVAWLGRAIAWASRTAISFESAFAGVKKTFEATAEWYAEVRKGLIDLSKRLPITFEELSAVAEAAWQLGVKGEKNLLRFTEVAVGLGIATNLSAEDAATSLKRFSDVLWVPIEQIENLWSTLVSLWNNFAANEQEILEFAKRAQTAWVVSNLTAIQILGLSTALVASWINAESWGTAIVQTFAKINKAALEGWPALEKFATVAWMTAEEFKTWFGENAWATFSKFMDWLNKSWQEWAIVLDKLWINSSRAQQAFLALAGNSATLEEAMQNANTAFDENAALQDEVNKRLDTTESKLMIAKNNWRALGSVFGDTFNKILIPLVNSATNAINWFMTKLQLAFVVAKNVAHNMGAAFHNMSIGTKMAFNSIIGFVESMVNQTIKGISKLAWAIPGAEQLFWDLSWGVTLGRVDVSWSLKAYKSLDAWTEQYLNNTEKLNEKALESTKSTVEWQIKEEQKLLKELLDIDNKKPSGWGGGRKLSSGYEKKASKERISLYEEESKEIDKIRKDNEKKDQERYKKLEGFAGDAFKSITNDIKDSQKLIEDYDKEINKINESISDMQSSSGESLANRVVEIREMLKGDVSGQERLDLTNELRLAEQNVTKEMLDRAKMLSEESETDRILRELEEKQIALETEKLQLEEKKQFEIDNLTQLEQTKEDLLSRFEQFDIGKKNAESKRVDELIQKYKKLNAMRGGWQGIPSSGAVTQNNTTNNANNTNNNTNNSNIVVNIDGWNPDQLIDTLVNFSEWNNK